MDECPSKKWQSSRWSRFLFWFFRNWLPIENVSKWLFSDSLLFFLFFSGVSSSTNGVCGLSIVPITEREKNQQLQKIGRNQWAEKKKKNNEQIFLVSSKGGSSHRVRAILALIFIDSCRYFFRHFFAAGQGCQMVHIFSNQKSRFGWILEGLEIKDVDILYGHLVYITNIWYIFAHLVYFW
jgi:hypothetical protein